MNKATELINFWQSSNVGVEWESHEWEAFVNDLVAELSDLNSIKTASDNAAITQPARIGGVNFTPGVEVHTVINAAYRHYERENTPEKRAESQRLAAAFVNAVNSRTSQISTVRDGLEIAAAYLEKKANDYANQYASDDMGSLSFGRGSHADIKSEYYNNLLEQAEEIRALDPQLSEPAQFEASEMLRDLIERGVRKCTCGPVRHWECNVGCKGGAA